MSVAIYNKETYPGRSFSVSQLLYVAKRKLQEAAFGGRIATTANQNEVNILERNALEVLGLVWSMKNSFAPINRIPPEILSLIPDYLDENTVDQDLIMLTHVCRSWRTIFTSRPSLWSYLDCKNVDKTRAYIERSKVVPLKICLGGFSGRPYAKDAFLLAAPHIHRLRHLSILTDDFSDIVNYFFHRVPLLKELNISLSDSPNTVLSDAFLDGDLPSLCALSLTGVITHLPWENFSNLTTFSLSCIPPDRISMNQLLNFFESSPLLHTIILKDSLPNSSDAPPNRTVFLPPWINSRSVRNHHIPCFLTTSLSRPARCWF